MGSDDQEADIGHMAAQQATSPVPPEKSLIPTTAVILCSPATPVLSPDTTVQDLVDLQDLLT